MLLDVYVPTGVTTILPGSAIVAEQTSRERALVHYEGARYGQQMTFQDRLLHAASRLIERYPTSACGIFAVAGDHPDLRTVGTYDAELHNLTIDDPLALADWLGLEPGELQADTATFGTPRPPAAVSRDDPDYFSRLSVRIEREAPLSSSEAHDAIRSPARLSPVAAGRMFGARN